MSSLSMCLRIAAPLVFLEVFSGSGRLAQSILSLGGYVMCWDISLGPQYDLLDIDNQRLLRGWLLAGLIWGLHLGTPCTSFSRARHPAVRSGEHVEGLQQLSKQQQAQVDTGNALLKFSCSLLRVARRMGIACTLENPATSYMFLMPCLLQLLRLKDCNIAVTEYCMFGTPWRKSTKLIGFNINLDVFAQYRCIDKPRGVCRRTNRPHTVLSGWENGVARTLIAQPYPRKFCRELANCFYISVSMTLATVLQSKFS